MLLSESILDELLSKNKISMHSTLSQNKPWAKIHFAKARIFSDVLNTLMEKAILSCLKEKQKTHLKLIYF